uniref:FAD-dependent oxidoreductase n=1 Tax=Sphingobium sp. CFD-1 TaxID=2878545 RepID=UPI00214BCB9A|nr:FAD-dependent monooxygenase [Sphingobium sp. CFD-1]
MSADYTVDVLVVGAGPAGATMALLLATYGIPVLAVARHPRSAPTPRAHITNQRTMEIMRDMGIEETCLRQASPAKAMSHTLWIESMVGEEIARGWSWGQDPARKGEYEASSPCSMSDLPQSLFEPILIESAIDRGAKIRFDSQLVSFVQDDEGVLSTILDRLTGKEYTVRSKYMIGADGGRSVIMEQLGIPLEGQADLAEAFNVYCEIDLTRFVQHRPGSLYFVIDPEAPLWAFVGNFRMVRPWNQWLVTLFSFAQNSEVPPLDKILERIRIMIGDDSVEIKVNSTYRWTINDLVAERYSEGRVFCMGDAVHRHPPANGLGSNTSVQDAYNLAWKLALVLKGRAEPSLLDSYNEERRPIGRQIVTRANKSMRYDEIWAALGAVPSLSVAERLALKESLASPSAEGKARRAELRRVVDDRKYEVHAHGVELNQRYESGAIIPDGSPQEPFREDAELFYQPSTRPGAHLPHAWVGTKIGRNPPISTLDLAGKGQFTLFTGIGGEGWQAAAEQVAAEFGVPIVLRRIGFGLEYKDLYDDWARLSDIAEDGCLLVRPDMFVAWRSKTIKDDCGSALRQAMAGILGRCF